jgi:uncharacterized protein YbbC (DUF1343 family)
VKNVVSGLDVLIETPELVGERRWALLANHAAVTASLDPARSALLAAGVGPLARLFAPEHGLDGIAQDMESVEDLVDPLTGCRIRSLYGEGPSTFAPRPEDLEDLDVLLVDLPDIGSRYYTFAASMDAAMRVCEEMSVEVMVLDRPNPIGGVTREGGPVGAGFESFVSQLPVPARHGLTLGEIAMLLHRERYPNLELTVVPCRGWRRDQWWDETGLPWVPPSPNMPTLDAATVYPGLCAVEATNLSEGRGTTRPFHLVGAPWIDEAALEAALRGLQIEGVAFRAARFRPEFQKHAGEVCRGVELHVVDRLRLRPLALGLKLLAAVHDLHPESFAWRTEPYEFVSEVPALDLLTGSGRARDHIENSRPLDPLFAEWQQYVEAFESTLEGIVLYHEEG